MAEPFIEVRKTRKPGTEAQMCYEVFDGDTGGSLGYFDEEAQALQRAESMNGMIERRAGRKMSRPSEEAEVE